MLPYTKKPTYLEGIIKMFSDYSGLGSLDKLISLKSRILLYFCTNTNRYPLSLVSLHKYQHRRKHDSLVAMLRAIKGLEH